jgi:large subunit ribosomal protein L17
MIRNMVTSLLKHERIRTTKTRAKEVRRYAEKMITIAKKDSLAAKRQVLAFVRERDVVSKLFKTLIYRYAERKGGYTRILKLAPRPGDGADMVFLELVDRAVAEKTEDPKTQKKSEAAPAAGEGSAETAPNAKKKKEAAASV